MRAALSILQICNAVVIEKRINFAKMNNNNSILLVDPNFNPNAAIHCNLLLKITADSLCYVIVNTESNRVEVLYDRQNFQDQKNELMRLLHADPYLRLSFNTVKICSYTINSISIPNDFYNGAMLDSYAPYFTEPEHYSSVVNSIVIPTREFKTIFLFPQVIEDAMNRYWPDAKKFEQTAPLLSDPKTQVSDLNGGAGYDLMVDFTAGSFFAMLMRNGDPIFQNFFLTEDADEFTYYLLLIFKQLQLDPAQIDVLISGIINEGDPQQKVLQQYFRSVKWNVPPAENLENTILEDMPAHYYTSLLALQLCG
jgi:hypothetical protein